MAYLEDTDVYTVPDLARIFHAFPHFSITFHRVNSTFNPRDALYLESLGILASVPAAWLILSLLCLLLYLLTRCCDRNSHRKRNITLLKWTLGFLALVCCAVVALGLYGNDELHNSTVDLVSSAKQIDELMSSIYNQTSSVMEVFDTAVTPQLKALDELFKVPVVHNKSVQTYLQESVEKMGDDANLASETIRSVKTQMEPFRLKTTCARIQLSENFRWPITLSVLCLFFLFCIILLAGLCRHSRCILITFSVCGLFAVILNWLLASLYLATAIAVSDFCIDPDAYLTKELGSQLKRNIVQYYVTCNGSNPFASETLTSQHALEGLERTLTNVSKIAAVYFLPSDLNPPVEILEHAFANATSSVYSLSAVLDCTSIHVLYVKGLNSVCDIGLYGLTFMLLSAIGAGLLYTVLVWMDSHTWIYIRKRRERSQEEERDPFLPPSSSMNSRRSQGSYGSTGLRPPRHAHTPPPTPPFPGTLNGRVPREEKPSSVGHAHAHTSRDGPTPMLGPNNGQYPTLSKQCKTLESSDFY